MRFQDTSEDDRRKLISQMRALVEWERERARTMALILPTYTHTLPAITATPEIAAAILRMRRAEENADVFGSLTGEDHELLLQMGIVAEPSPATSESS